MYSSANFHVGKKLERLGLTIKSTRISLGTLDSNGKPIDDQVTPKALKDKPTKEFGSDDRVLRLLEGYIANLERSQKDYGQGNQAKIFDETTIKNIKDENQARLDRQIAIDAGSKKAAENCGKKPTFIIYFYGRNKNISRILL